MKAERTNWIDSLSWQIDFSERHGYARRSDPEFEWRAYEGRSLTARFELPGFLMKAARIIKPGRARVDLTWLRDHSHELWETRNLLSDELSRLIFDQVLVLRATSHRRFYFPRLDFADLVRIMGVFEFREEGYPHDYLGIPLKVFQVVLLNEGAVPLTVITREVQLRLVNSYRQYLVKRDDVQFAPGPGSVVLDCGACIGEISMLFAGLATATGQVHLFDPLPVHVRMCQLQARLNPQYLDSIYINPVAVGDRSRGPGIGNRKDDGRIAPDAADIEEFACTTIDEYASSLSMIDYIKMDIEGSEMPALRGAASVLRELGPRLAISGYHRPEDLWEIPALIRSLNPRYRLAFGHHTPVSWESVFYAVDAAADSQFGRRAARI